MVTVEAEEVVGLGIQQVGAARFTEGLGVGTRESKKLPLPEEKMPETVPPQGLCTCCSLCQERSFSNDLLINPSPISSLRSAITFSERHSWTTGFKSAAPGPSSMGPSSPPYFSNAPIDA